MVSNLEDNYLRSLSKTEQVALRLIKSDLQFLYTTVENKSITGASYVVALLPYVGLIIDGCERWTKKVPLLRGYVESFSDAEKQYYTEMRNSIKLWEMPFSELFSKIKEKYDESEKHFSSCCKQIAKKMKLYDIYGAYLINDMFCDNTILDMIFVPRFEFNHIDGQYIKNMAEIAGKIVAAFEISDLQTWDLSISSTYRTKDYGGFVKSPVKNSFSSNFVLFSMLCTVNFIIFGVDKYVVPEVPIKLRLAYIQYYYLVQQIPQINSQLKTQFFMDNRWIDSKGTFRNCMAHYGVGVALSQDEVIETDEFGGLTQKIFKQDWIPMKNSIVDELSQFSKQVRSYLGLT